MCSSQNSRCHCRFFIAEFFEEHCEVADSKNILVYTVLFDFKEVCIQMKKDNNPSKRMRLPILIVHSILQLRPAVYHLYHWGCVALRIKTLTRSELCIKIRNQKRYDSL